MHTRRGLALQSLLNVVLAGLHHVLPHIVSAPVAVQERDRVFLSHARAHFAGELNQMGCCDFSINLFAFLLLSHVA